MAARFPSIQSRPTVAAAASAATPAFERWRRGGQLCGRSPLVVGTDGGSVSDRRRVRGLREGVREGGEREERESARETGSYVTPFSRGEAEPSRRRRSSLSVSALDVSSPCSADFFIFIFFFTAVDFFSLISPSCLSPLPTHLPFKLACCRLRRQVKISNLGDGRTLAHSVSPADLPCPFCLPPRTHHHHLLLPLSHQRRPPTSFLGSGSHFHLQARAWRKDSKRHEGSASSQPRGLRPHYPRPLPPLSSVTLFLPSGPPFLKFTLRVKLPATPLPQITFRPMREP